ncbi:MAG: two-component sensor histidine kinase, partial [Rhizobiales bacterium]|nr:two-component sensor histidine kinase [Hyphomicrobiales bacterium]
MNRMAADIAARDGDDMRPIADTTAPVEIQPLLSALNGLFGKVETARQHERDVTSFAAHELRTPLAGLKTQAQVALTANDEQARASALRQIILSVDRASRLTRQLLTLARLESMPAVREQESMRVDVVLQDVINACQAPPGVCVVVDPELQHLVFSGDRECLHLVLRNLHENAIAHSPDGGTIVWQALADGLSVEDDGPGIAEDELALVTQRFYRGRGAKSSGTGLGLTIAAIAASRIAARITLENKSERSGLRCILKRN